MGGFLNGPYKGEEKASNNKELASLKDRIKEFKRIPAKKLRENPANWRQHPQEQREALKGLLSEIGFAGALLARTDDKGQLVLIDGHLRKEIADNETVPVLITDLTEAEADLLLAAYDPIAAMARADEPKLQELLARIHSEDEGLSKLLGKMRTVTSMPSFEELAPNIEPIDINEHWTGMPEFKHEDLTSSRKIIVHFRNDEDAKKFGELLNQQVTEKTKSLWYPQAEIETQADKRWEDES